jgi:hypothetical protein
VPTTTPQRKIQIGGTAHLYKLTPEQAAHRVWLPLGRMAAIAVTVTAALVGVSACANGTGNKSAPPTSAPPTSAPTTTAPTTAPTTTAAPTTTTGAPSQPPTTALAALAALPVKGRAPMTGYRRDQFGPPWTDDVTVADGHNGCDTRNDILRRDLVNVVIKTGTQGCVVASGVLNDPYTSAVINFTRGSTSAAIQIDHVVALGDAWQTGAQQLSLAERTNVANDPLELLAVSGPANEQKGDADAASWLPPNKAFRCPYVAEQVAVKIQYHLWVTPAEHDAIANVLVTCPAQPLPTGGAPNPTTPSSTPPSTAPPPAPSPASTTPGQPVVHAGAFCSPPGAMGVTSAGTPMTCKLDSTGQRYRWSRA